MGLCSGDVVPLLRSDRVSPIDRDTDEPDEKYYLDKTLNKFSNNIVKELEKRDINVDVYTANLRIDLNKIIISLLK